MNALKDKPPPPRRHLAQSDSELCWCGEKASPEHAKTKNDGADDDRPRVFREG